MALNKSLNGSLPGVQRVSMQAFMLAALTFLLRVPFWARPLDMDEGLYAYGGWQMLKGLILYKDLWDFKPPGTYFLNALMYGLNSPDAVNIYICAALFGALACLAVYKVAYTLWGRGVALLSGVIFAFYSVSPYIQGCGVNTEIFMITPLTWFLWAILKAVECGEKKFYIVSGLFAGLAVLFKQVSGVGLLLGVCAAAYAGLPRDRSIKRGLFFVAAFLLGAIMPWVAVGLYFLSVGAFKDWLSWQVVYPFTYMGYTFHEQTWRQDWERVSWTFQGTLMLWCFAVVGLASVVKRGSALGEKIVALFFPLSAAGVLAGWNLFPHYFVQMAPVVALFSGRGVQVLYRRIWPKRSLLLSGLLASVLLLTCLLFVKSHYRFFFVYTGDEISVHEYLWTFPPSPIFGTARSLGLDLRRATKETDTIFVWKHHPEINFYALRKTPARSPIQSLPNVPQLRAATVRDIEAARLDYFVLFDPLSPFRFEQLNAIVGEQYVKVYSVTGLPFPEQGVYRRKVDE